MHKIFLFLHGTSFFVILWVYPKHKMRVFHQIIVFLSGVTLIIILLGVQEPSTTRSIACPPTQPCTQNFVAQSQLYKFSDGQREEAHLYRMEQRKMLIERIQTVESSKKLWIQMRNIWNVHEPTWSCPWEERFGGLGDGGTIYQCDEY
jgi:hypothetical protein